jgi:anti-sigma regulatory factor (Ser/Thr protein kinase)
MENFETFMGFMENSLGSIDVPQKTVFSLLTVSEEIIVNIINYAYPDKVGEMEIEFEADENAVWLTFVDEGVPFNPLEKSEVNTDLEAHERDIGGLGIHMIKSMTDRVAYDFKDEKNVLIIEKRI